MPLNVSKIDQSMLAILNRWAREMENNHYQLSKQVQELAGQLRGTTNPSPKQVVKITSSATDASSTGGSSGSSSPVGVSLPYGPRTKSY